MEMRNTIFIGAHPDDPEEVAGGTIAKFTHDPHLAGRFRVILVYMTSGGAGIFGRSRVEAEQVRVAEAKAACEILKAEPHFLGGEDGNLYPTPEVVAQLVALLKKCQPAVVFTNWPVDTHRDHRATATAVLDAFGKVYGSEFGSPIAHPFDFVGDAPVPGLFLWETEPGLQSLQFPPDCYVAVDDWLDVKLAAIAAHASQNRNGRLAEGAEQVARMRASEAGTKYWAAKGFMRLRPAIRE